MRMHHRILTALLTMAMAMVCVGCGGKPPREHYEKAGGFSYDPPAGWTMTEVPGIKYRISAGPPAKRFTPNINVVDETFRGSLTAYVDGNMTGIENQLRDLKILAREDFKTNDNEAMVKVVIENKQQGRMLRQTFYFVGSGRRKYVITCTALADGGAKLDPVFEESVATFRIH